MRKPRVLFICGSRNQTTQLHQIYQQLKDEIDAWWTPYYIDGIWRFWQNLRIFDWVFDRSIAGNGQFRQWTCKYLVDQKLQIDDRARKHTYDLVITCTDMVVQKVLRQTPWIQVQEGMTDPENWIAPLIKAFKLQNFIGGTGLTGQSKGYDLFCVASQGYYDFFASKGIPREKMRVTGIPNFDHCAQFLNNDFPHRGYAMVATSDLRETFKKDDRMGFLRRCKELARGKPLLFKLHPNEEFARAIDEIKSIAPEALIYTEGNTDHMVANCDILITQYSTVVYTGIALGKEVHSFFDVEELRKLAPLQNGGASARNIARLIRQWLVERELLPRRSMPDSPARVLTLVQARTGSTRLPGKVLMPILDEPVLLRQLERIARSRSAGTLAVITTTEASDDPVVELCRKAGYPIFRGHPTDLLDRHYQAAVHFGFGSGDAVVKIPSDCPLIDPQVIDRVIGEYQQNIGWVDFTSNLHPATYPDGHDVEAMSFEALEQAWREARRPLEREHTTPYLWENPQRFRLRNVTWETGLDYSMSHRWTLDYAEDFEFVRRVYEELYPKNPAFSISDVLALLDRKPEIRSINARYAGVNWYRNHLDELKTVTSNQTRKEPSHVP